MEGTWDGTFNTATSSATVSMTVHQSKIDIDGVYHAPAAQVSVFGTDGIVEGVTTGSTFLVTLTPNDSGCAASVKLSGANDGSNMQFSFTGVDCSSASFVGQGYFAKQ
jgi:hypothetical protein